MNVFNRIVMALAILCWVVLVAFVLVRPLDAVDIVRATLTDFERGIFDDQFFAIFLAAGGGVLLLLIILFVLEVSRPRRKTVRVRTQGGGNVQLATRSVAQNIEYRVDELPGVRRVVPHVTSHGNTIEIALDLDTSPTVNIPDLTAQVVSMCHDIAEGQLGLRIRGKVRVNIRHEPYPRGEMPARSPAAPAPSSSVPSATEVPSAPSVGASPSAVAPVSESAAMPPPEPSPTQTESR